MNRNAPDRYSTLGLTLHWVTAAVVLTAFIYGPGGPEARVYSAARDFDRQLHETLGLVVFTLVLLRMAWRAGAAIPAPPPGPPWQARTARAVQFAMYVLMVALPVTAVTGAWLEGHPLTLLGGVEVPPRLAEWRAAGTVVAEVHGWLGDTIMWLAGLHAAAGLFHHFVLRDGVLASMLPGRLVRRRSAAR